MKTRDFSFELPEELIAQFPADRRENSRLLFLDRNSGLTSHHRMTDLPSLLPQDALLVVNDSRVRKARLYGTTQSGTSRELLFLERDTESDGDTWIVMTKRPGRLRTGMTLALPGNISATVVGHVQRGLVIRFRTPLTEDYFETYGHVPLPPYIRRADQEFDSDRYQTVYAAKPGSVAAPTAGLHLTQQLLQEIEARGLEVRHVTLHVGPGTFLPVRSESVDDHVMHSEQYEISDESACAINTARSHRRPIIAVGTTSVRTLESAFDPDTGDVRPGRRSTDIFIRPGYVFRVVTGLLTNFHTPESTLLMLVSAFTTRERVLAAYREAIDLRYRFFSYGDGMLILPGPPQ